MRPEAEMSKADRKKLKEDIERSEGIPEDQHCQRCGKEKDAEGGK